MTHLKGLFGNLASNPAAGVMFSLTNESLDAVVAGLKPGRRDTVLSVAGCGDYAFSLLEYSGKVFACDVNKAQLDLLIKRKKALEAGDYNSFFNPSGIDFEFFNALDRMRYFRESDRIAKIMDRLGNLEILHMSLEESARNGSFDKIYASNAIGELYCGQDLAKSLLAVAGGLKHEGLLYVSNGAEIGNLVPKIEDFGLHIDEGLTSMARDIERVWTPTIYRRA